MAEKYNGIEKFIFADVYNLFLKYKDMACLEDNWETYLKEVDALSSKYFKFPLAVQMLNAVTMDLEMRINGRKLSGLSYNDWLLKINSSNNV